MVKVFKQWTTIASVASTPGVKSQRVVATYDHFNKKIELNTDHQESVSFKGNTIEEAELKAKAILKAIKYIKDDLNK